LKLLRTGDEDFDYQQDGGKAEPSPQRRRHVVVSDARKPSIASSAALEDWDAEEHPTADDPLPSSATSETSLHQHVEHQTDNWDDFEDSRNSPEKVTNASPNGRKEENWDDDMALGEETEDESAELGFAEKEEDRTVNAKSRRAALKDSNDSLPRHLPRFHLHCQFVLWIFPNTTRSISHFSTSLPSSVFSIPNTNQTHDYYYSSTTHLCLTSAFAFLSPSPPILKEKERQASRLEYEFMLG